jgi:hypothetical protein
MWISRLPQNTPPRRNINKMQCLRSFAHVAQLVEQLTRNDLFLVFLLLTINDL